MKKLPLKNSSYQYLEIAFKEWLDILGYCAQSVDHTPTIIREFLYFIDAKGVSQITQLQQKHYKAYFNYISSRTNQRRGGGLSNNYLNKHIQSLEKFYEFLNHKGIQGLPPVGLKQLKLNKGDVTVLTQEEIQELYKATIKSPENCRGNDHLQEAFNSRDRVILTIYYACGMRRNEGANLDLGDINLDTRIIHVRKGKNNKERFLPFSKTSLKYLQEWIYDYRPILVNSKKESRLFIGKTGRTMSGGSLYTRLKQLQLKVDNPILQQKTINLHTLRHSIATHLLENGMELQKIQRFLGHSSLESTQIYTHLIQKEDEANI